MNGYGASCNRLDGSSLTAVCSLSERQCTEMKINLRRGLLRLWVTASVIWVLGVAGFTYVDINRSREVAAQAASLPDGFQVIWPMRCSVELRGKFGTDYTKESDGLCWYTTHRFRALYPEYADIDDRKLASQLHAKAGVPLTEPSMWAIPSSRIAIAIGVPFAVLALGWALRWVLSGFKGATADS